MKKIVSTLLIVTFLVALAAVTLTGCSLFKSISLDDVRGKLEDAGYTVTVMTGDEYVETEDAVSTIMAFELDHYLYAVKGEDVIHLFFFTSTDEASDNLSFISFKGLSQGQHNEVVYAATKQAKADAGI